MRILIVEDDPSIHRIISRRLREEGYAVDDCYDGEEGLDYILSTAYDCVILDWMLPRKDGIALLKEMRSGGNSVPVLMLTAKDTVSNRVDGLDAGADDYLTKPFAYDELSARVRALLRRNMKEKQTVLQAADLCMDLAAHKVTRDGREIQLTSKEFALLEYLMRNQRIVLTRSQIAAWGSYILAKRALKPIHQITQTAQSIRGSDWSKRIEGIQSVDEVGELAGTFNKMLDALEISFRRERQFTSDASHELRTPMTVIRVCTDDALQTEDAEIVQENLLMIKKENAKMTKMLSQLLFLSRGYEGRQHFEPEDILLSDMVESVMEEFAAEAKEKSIEIHNLVAERTFLYADQSLFTQLLMNLIGNAVKYGKENGNIWIGVRCDEGGARLYIRDDGMGIAKEDREHIFERFYRADKARDRSGSGLGLSIAKWIVEMHGGRIWAESRPGEGTVFYVTLPGGIRRYTEPQGGDCL